MSVSWFWENRRRLISFLHFSSRLHGTLGHHCKLEFVSLIISTTVVQHISSEFRSGRHCKGASTLHFTTWLPLILTDTRRIRLGMPVGQTLTNGTCQQKVHITLIGILYRHSVDTRLKMHTSHRYYRIFPDSLFYFIYLLWTG